jgi:hypothetical protein
MRTNPEHLVLIWCVFPGSFLVSFCTNLLAGNLTAIAKTSMVQGFFGAAG